LSTGTSPLIWWWQKLIAQAMGFMPFPSDWRTGPVLFFFAPILLT